jgi:hypothetical protein
MPVQIISMGLLVSLTCLLVAACAPQDPGDDPGGPLELSVEPLEVRAGEEVMLTLANRSSDDVGYNLCPAVLDRREGEEWVERPERPAEVCTMELRILAPDASSTYRHTVPARLPAGEYRFRVGVEMPLGEGRVEVSSHPVQVGG